MSERIEELKIQRNVLAMLIAERKANKLPCWHLLDLMKVSGETMKRADAGEAV